VNKTLLCVRELFWFCKFCVDGGDGPCDNHSHVQPWDLVALEPCFPIDDRCDLEMNDMWEVSPGGETLAACLKIGNYFVLSLMILGQRRGLKNPWAGEEDVFLVHPQNGLNGLILNWCTGGCRFTPAAAMELPTYQSHHPLHLEVSKVLHTFLLVKQPKRPAISGYQSAFISLKTK